jgi:hypothetical protein
VPTMLYLASILVGLAHGAHWTLMVATSSELFGLKNFGALYNTLRFGTFSCLLSRVLCRCLIGSTLRCLAHFLLRKFLLTSVTSKMQNMLVQRDFWVSQTGRAGFCRSQDTPRAESAG